MYKIKEIKAREILDSRGYPTIEVEVISEEGIVGRASVPSGASTGEYEAHELRDEDQQRYLGKGVGKAVEHIHHIIYKALLDKSVLHQREIDETMIQLDGTENKERLGANAILGVSMACCVCASHCLKIPLYRYIGGINSYRLPVPMMNIINGGRHSDNGLDFQEFMIIPISANSFKDALEMGSNVFHCLKDVLAKNGYQSAVGDEGGFAPDIESHDQAIQLIIEAIKKAGYLPKKDIVLALDVASSEFYHDQRYHLKSENKVLTSKEMVSLYEDLIRKYPIVSIEDGLNENDWEGWRYMTERIGHQIQLVGDDLFVTNTHRLLKGIERKAGNSILIKVNQIGTITETLEAIALAKTSGMTTIISHRSGETEDTFISDLAVAVSAGQIKTGSLSRSERIAKYNQLLRIEEQLGKESQYGSVSFIAHF